MTKKSKTLMALAFAAVITLIIRLTVFGADCNLLVVGITFLLSWAFCTGILSLFSRVIRS